MSTRGNRASAVTGEFVQVQTIVERRDDAERIAQTLVERRLAACVQIVGPIQSTYWWKEKIETAEEWLCLIKTRSDLYDAIEAAIIELHSYEVPEIVALPIVAGSANYLRWLVEETCQSDQNAVP